MSGVSLPRTLTATIGAVLGVGSLLLPLGEAPSATAQPCPDIEVVFARGTGEPAGIGEVGQSFVDSLRSQVGGRSVAAYGVNYPANRIFIGATSGAKDVNARVGHMAVACPDTRMVLGGYSQGAAVIDIVAGVEVAGVNVGSPLPAHLVERVAAVAVFGNPSKKLFGSLAALSPTLGYKSIDLCSAGDPICSEGRDRSAHNAYTPSGLTSQAASFVAARV